MGPPRDTQGNAFAPCAPAPEPAVLDATTLPAALLRTDPRLSRFNPLPRILTYDDFDDGVNGWCNWWGTTMATWIRSGR